MYMYVSWFVYLLAARISHKENLFMNTENEAVIEEMRFFKVNVN